MDKKLIIIGAGPAGLTAAYKILKLSKDIKPIVLEKNPVRVGGISSTIDYKNYKFDIGGHRFFSKSDEVVKLWEEIMGDDLIERPRLSRIYYKKKFYSYPLKIFEALRNLGPRESILIMLSYAKAKLFPVKNPKTFEEWVSNNFGYRLYALFFKAYTEKVWGISCKKLSADWAAQRIKGLSISTLLLDTAKKKLNYKQSNQNVIKTLIDKFKYPKKGPGQLWEKTATLIREMGGDVVLDRTVVRVETDRDKVASVICRDSNGNEEIYEGDYFMSTMPIKDLVNAITPALPGEVVEAANKLSYRDFISVALIVDQEDIFPDTWIYIHEPNVSVGRIQNFNNWSPYMVPDKGKTCLGLEYFCFEGDNFWNKSDEELSKLAKKELDYLGLAPKDKVVDSCVVRMPKAYPVYDEDYKKYIDVVKDHTDKFSNLYLIGRNGMHKYNNQDHSMMTAIIAVRNLLGEKNLDPWKVNTDAEYQEESYSEKRYSDN